MSEVVINFESEEREGLVAVGTYLSDAAKRLGIDVECDCIDEEVETKGSCAMKISAGDKLLSAPTELELELLSDTARKNGERLACQTKIEKAGEVTVMSVKKKEEVKEESKVEEEVHQEEYKKQFEELPLEKKISNLMELEAIALGETFSYVMNSPYAAAGKVMDVLAGFGLKMEKEDHKAKRPDEHIEKDEKDESNDKDIKVPHVKKEEKTDKKKSPATAKKKAASKSTTSKKTAEKKTSEAKGNTKKNTVKEKEDE